MLDLKGDDYSFQISIKGKNYFIADDDNLRFIAPKHPKHFSSISHVWMPWSVNFYGPYFV